jgi:hypothetical protein
LNTKRKYRPGPDAKVPEYLHEFGIRSGSKTYPVTKGTLVSVIRKPGLIAGKYEVLYAERSGDTLLITVEGPDSRIVDERYRKVIRESDIKSVHIKTRGK